MSAGLQIKRKLKYKF